MALRGNPVGTSSRRYLGRGLGRSGLVAACSAALVLVLTAGSIATASATSASTKPSTAATEDLLTYHYQNARQGVDDLDPSFRHLKPAWTTNGSKISGDIYAEPLVDGKTVFVVTEADDVYALAASTGAVEWKVNVGNPAQSGSVQAAPGLGGCGDIYPLGITGTPVIDPTTGVLYLAAEVQKTGATWTGVAHIMVAIRLND
ncbi:MAG: PQQ-binding-like beta-propeller repeat protein, partial [Acidimicrobiales bacterium]